MGTENRVRNLHLFIWTGIAEYWRDRTLNRDNREWIGCGLLKLKKAPQDELKRLIKVHCRFQKGSLWKLIRGSTILFHKLGHNKPRNEIHYSSFRLKMVKRGDNWEHQRLSDYFNWLQTDYISYCRPRKMHSKWSKAWILFFLF